MPRVYHVVARWDGEAGVWVAESEDVPGLIAEAASPNALNAKLRVLVPELLQLNAAGPAPGEPVEFIVRYHHEESSVTALAS